MHPGPDPDPDATGPTRRPDGTSRDELSAAPETTDPSGIGEIWASAQQTPATQRRGRYLPESTAHPAKMLPAVAARAITDYSPPGGLVLDPMCGIGTTLVEAQRLGHPALGVEYEARWATLARRNLALTTRSGSGGDETHQARATVLRGDARQLARLLPTDLRGQVDLVVTSPPYGPSTHGQLANRPGEAIRKVDHRYGDALDRGNLANIGHHRLLGGFTRILRAAAEFLRPGGHVVITARPWREHGELIDLPSQVFACGVAAGLTPVARHVALLGRITGDGQFVARGSFFQRDLITKRRAAGLPLHLIAHEDVLVLRRDQTPHPPRAIHP